MCHRLALLARALVLLRLLLAPHLAHARTRVYHLSIDAARWDYYPPSPATRGRLLDRCTAAPFAADQRLFIGGGSDHHLDDDAASDLNFTPTSVYQKLVFRLYAANFTARVPRNAHERHLALLGPVLRAAVGDTLLVVLRGPPRVPPAIARELFPIAFQLDGVLRVGKHPLLRRPRQIVRLRFRVTAAAAAAASAHVDSRMLLYRATLRGSGPDGSAGIYRGLLGPAVVYRRGGLSPSNLPRAVGRELFAVLWVGDENVGDEQGDEREGNLMHSINGRVFCKLPRFEFVEGSRARLYLGAVGNEVDVHTAHMHGVVGVSAGGEHVDSVRLLPGSTAALELVTDNVGVWLFHCHVNDHLHAGMQALLAVRPAAEAGKKVPPFVPSRQRVYFVQAEDVVWDYAPRGRNRCDRTAFGDDELIFVDDGFEIELSNNATGFGIGSKYVKSQYVQYTDRTFSDRVARERDDEHLGLMGPVLRARVGEEIVIHFRNRASVPVSMHPHGVLYDKANEGAPYNDGSTRSEKLDDRIEPGGSYTYRWQVPERAGPGPGERQQTKLWIYHSHRNEILDTYAGLFGAIVVVSRDAEFDEETLLPSDGTREVFLHMSVMNEAGSFHFEQNVLRNKGNRQLSSEQIDELIENEDFQESNLMHSINGFVYCNGPLISLSQGQPTRFYFYALGTEVDLHTPMIGNEVLRLDVEASRGSGTLLAGSFSSALVFPRHKGLDELRCNVNDHVIAGMRALYFVDDASGSRDVDPEDFDVTHYIAADEIEWDYTPLGKDGCTGHPFGEDEKVFTEPGPVTPGSRYVKAVYREYHDASFSRLKGNGKRSFSGVVGPLLHFQVGEVVHIVFQNNLRFGVNINFVGLELLNSTSGGTLAVSPGDHVNYVYRVRHEAGPSTSDLNAVPYVYYSSVDPIAHTAAGLTGVIAVTKRGRLRKATRLPKGTNEAYPLLLNIFRENDSPLIRRSLRKFALDPGNITSAVLEELSEDEDWLESSAMHSINGYLYGNNPVIRAKAPSVIRFYVFGYGSEASMHSPVWMGQIVQRKVFRGNAANGVQILPFNAETVDVKTVNRGKWPIICKVADHVVGGMKLCMKVS